MLFGKKVKRICIGCINGFDTKIKREARGRLGGTGGKKLLEINVA